jgi:hypothetical protein
MRPCEPAQDDMGARDGAVIDLIAAPLVTEEQIAQARAVSMRRMRREGFSLDVVAKFFNCSVPTVKRHTRRLGHAS